MVSRHFSMGQNFPYYEHSLVTQHALLGLTFRLVLVQMMFVCWMFTLCSAPCSDILEECTASMCRVTEFVQVAGEVMRWKMMFWLYSNV